MHSHIDKVLWTAEEVSLRISEIAAEIVKDFPAPSPLPVFVGVATGAFLFFGNLVCQIDLPITVDFIRTESCGSGTMPDISFNLKLDIDGRHVILVEDVVDKEHTLSQVIRHLKSKGASYVSVCTLLEKPAGRRVALSLVGEEKFYRGFECSENVAVGYGIDFGELYRNLPYIGVLKPEYRR